MRVICCVIFIFSLSFTIAQSYVDSGIQKYQSGEFLEAIDFFNKGHEVKDALPNASIARVYLYRGMSKFELLKANGENAEAGITLQAVYSDIDNSIAYENVWPAKLKETKEELYNVLINYAEDSEKKASRESDFLQKVALLDDRVEYLKIAAKVDPTSDMNLLLGETHKSIGDIYFESTQDLLKLQIAKENYEESIKYFEIARYDDPFSKDIIKSLLEISNRLLDQDRIEEYEKLLELAGG